MFVVNLRLIRFKGIRVIDGKNAWTYLSLPFKAARSRFKLHSFKDIYDNSTSYHDDLFFDKYDLVSSWCTRRELFQSLAQFKSLTKLELVGEGIPPLGPNTFPTSLTSLTLATSTVPPQNTFTSLKSLTELIIEIEYYGEGVTPPRMDLESNLTHFIQLLVDYAYIPAQYTMPLLEKLYVPKNLLVSDTCRKIRN
ncbi:hypothetical protein DFA_09287 [Cavenderia fasciculata]|uniref:Uncharacterized protein n=1 Tax=Cavenderia fasciculata TaxID=261658 RepID=F4Q775_CACFS|nr:uncharacterized protein DFA_09287 [Cavenderia fasciculata]EGG16257.1 hypothetical protein DFA_09287 [Cavenderia fasciculata]|eukprot:XP_004354641.1 hypothetical protein DFA_09287 [Cavenderia fasciculata]